MLQNLFKFWLIGFLFLFYAIGLNALAYLLSITTWYDFLKSIADNNLNINVLDGFWLFIGYPLLLFLGFKWINSLVDSK